MQVGYVQAVQHYKAEVAALRARLEEASKGQIERLLYALFEVPVLKKDATFVSEEERDTHLFAHELMDMRNVLLMVMLEKLASQEGKVGAPAATEGGGSLILNSSGGNT